MVVEALRAYVQLASGLTDVTRERAVSAAKALVAQVGSMSDAPAESTAQVRALADELARMARGNRDLVMGMVRAETERAVASVGMASGEDLAALQHRVAALEETVATRLASTDAASSADAAPPVKASKPDTKAGAKKSRATASADDLTSAPKRARKSANAGAKTVPPAPDPAHATPADMPQHDPTAEDGGPALADAAADVAPGDGAEPSAPQDPSPPDVSTS